MNDEGLQQMPSLLDDIRISHPLLGRVLVNYSSFGIIPILSRGKDIIRGLTLAEPSPDV